MAVKTQWKIKYARCGHVETKDLGHKPADQRAGFAKWLAQKAECTSCWRKSTGKGEGWIEDKDEWLAQKRAKEAEDASAWAERAEMPELAGSEKATEWATRVRYQLLRQLYTWAVEEDNADEDTYEQAEDIARSIDTARWWLDNREQAEDDPEALLELLQAAAASGEGTSCENTL